MRVLIVWPFRAIKFLLNLAFLPIYLPFWALSKIGKGAGAAAKWPLERGMGHQIERAIVEEQRDIARGIVDERREAAKTAKEVDKIAIEQYWKQRNQQPRVVRRHGPGRQKLVHRRKN